MAEDRVARRAFGKLAAGEVSPLGKGISETTSNRRKAKTGPTEGDKALIQALDSEAENWVAALRLNGPRGAVSDSVPRSRPPPLRETFFAYG